MLSIRRRCTACIAANGSNTHFFNCNFRIYGYCFLIDCCPSIIFFLYEFKNFFLRHWYSILPNFNAINTLKISKFYEFQFFAFIKSFSVGLLITTYSTCITRFIQQFPVQLTLLEMSRVGYKNKLYVEKDESSPYKLMNIYRYCLSIDFILCS